MTDIHLTIAVEGEIDPVEDVMREIGDNLPFVQKITLRRDAGFGNLPATDVVLNFSDDD